MIFRCSYRSREVENYFPIQLQKRFCALPGTVTMEKVKTERGQEEELFVIIGDNATRRNFASDAASH